jgi:NADH dehydrogenase
VKGREYHIPLVGIAGGSGFIGGAIARRLARMPAVRVRILSRNPGPARKRAGEAENVEFAAADVTDTASVAAAIAGCDTIVNAVQFDGYPIENPRCGLTFERIDYGGTVAMIEAAKRAGAANFIYISGAAADENSAQPGFRAKGRAERAIRESGLSFTILRPSLVYGPGDKVVGMIAKALRFAPAMIVPGSGRQKMQPVLVDDVAACVALAMGGLGRGGTFEVGGPEPMSFDELVRIVMEITGRHRPIIHLPEGLLRMAGAAAEMVPGALFSRDAVAFLVADNSCDIAPLTAEFGIRLTPLREGLAYLALK